MARAYILSDLSFASDLKKLFEKTREQRLSQPFSNVVYTTWQEKTVRVDYAHDAITILGDGWFLDARIQGNYSVSFLDNIMVTGDIGAFEKWEMLIKLGS